MLIFIQFSVVSAVLQSFQRLLPVILRLLQAHSLAPRDPVHPAPTTWMYSKHLDILCSLPVLICISPVFPPPMLHLLAGWASFSFCKNTDTKDNLSVLSFIWRINSCWSWDLIEMKLNQVSVKLIIPVLP